MNTFFKMIKNILSNIHVAIYYKELLFIDQSHIYTNYWHRSIIQDKSFELLSIFIVFIISLSFNYILMDEIFYLKCFDLQLESSVHNIHNLINS